MIKYLKSLDNKKLAEIWCKFNVYEYPPELERYKPSNWDILPTMMKAEILRDPFRYIKKRVGEKELLREWNKDRYPVVEFDIWWENRVPLSDEAKKNIEATISPGKRSYFELNN